MKAIGKNICIIGCGWLGNALGKHLISRGHRVAGSTRSSAGKDRLEENGIVPLILDLGNPPSSLPDVMTEADWLILSTPPGPLAHSASWLTSNLSSGYSGRIIMMSSTAVYPDTGETVTEQDAIHRISPHSGVDLLDLEQRICSIAPAIILRLGGLYGPGRHPGRFLAGKKGLKNGNTPVNLIHQDDVAGITSSVIDLSPEAQTLNAVAPEHPSRQLFYTTAAQDDGLEAPEFSGRNDPESGKLVDSSRLIQTLGYVFKYPDPLAGFS